ncbi:unnamed protein product [Polarella glacialis]|uniref:Phosphoglycerate mutase n=1 Tax=Polarella glacialis TaxID=89957 RepID=A0A813FBS8_POLGL|nr:unnamed protein product [Polarella glacialis]
MRRATQTAIIGFADAISAGVPVLAQELCHEIAGKHTCDLRLSKQKLAVEFPAVNYGEVLDEEDPYWGDGLTRESQEAVSQRGSNFVRWLLERPETKVVVATHSNWLASLFNAVLEIHEQASDQAEVGCDLTAWFDTGEMRTVLLAPL